MTVAEDTRANNHPTCGRDWPTKADEDLSAGSFLYRAQVGNVVTV